MNHPPKVVQSYHGLKWLTLQSFILLIVPILLVLIALTTSNFAPHPFGPFFPSIHSNLEANPNQSEFAAIPNPRARSQTPPDPVQLDRYFQQLNNHQCFVGSAALYKDGELYTVAKGYLDEKQTIPVNNLTRYRYGSNTKTLVALLVMKAIEEKRLSLWTPLSWWFPQGDTGITVVDKVTIELMLNHRSMLYNFTDDPAFSPHGLTQKKILAIVARNQPSRPLPDSTPHGEYSNTNYYLLGKILEQIYQQPLQTLFKKFLFDPFGMTHSDCSQVDTDPDSQTPTPPRNARDEAVSFSPIPENKWTSPLEVTYFSWNATEGAGAVISTPSDMIRLYLNVFVHRKLITLESIKKMLNFKPLDGVMYGLGVFRVLLPAADPSITPHDGTPDNNTNNSKSRDTTSAPFHYGFGHNGLINGFDSFIAISPQLQGGDPLNDPFIIYTQVSNGHNCDLSNPTIDVTRYAYNPARPLPIPTFQNRYQFYPQYFGRWYCTQEPSLIFDFSSTGEFTVNDWNPSTQQFEPRKAKQLILSVPDQGVFALNETEGDEIGQYAVFVHTPLLVSMRFFDFGAKMKYTQNGSELDFLKK